MIGFNIQNKRRSIISFLFHDKKKKIVLYNVRELRWFQDRFNLQLVILRSRSVIILILMIGMWSNSKMSGGLYDRFDHAPSVIIISKYSQNDSLLSIFTYTIFRVIFASVIFSLLHLQTILPRLEFAQTQLWLNIGHCYSFAQS